MNSHSDPVEIQNSATESSNNSVSSMENTNKPADESLGPRFFSSNRKRSKPASPEISSDSRKTKHARNKTATTSVPENSHSAPLPAVNVPVNSIDYYGLAMNNLFTQIQVNNDLLIQVFIMQIGTLRNSPELLMHYINSPIANFVFNYLALKIPPGLAHRPAIFFAPPNASQPFFSGGGLSHLHPPTIQQSEALLQQNTPPLPNRMI